MTLLAARESEALLLQLQKLQDENLRLLEKQVAAGGASAFELTQARIAAQGAQLAWRGLRARPVWRILLYSADTPPSMRGLVELDALIGLVRLAAGPATSPASARRSAAP